MKYVFGSEEYGDVVNTGFAPDVFGVFVNGVNYARVPGGSVAVSTASINCGGPVSGAANGVNPQNCSLYRDNPPFFGKIETELDGLTVVLTLTAPVMAGQVNTIQLGIANSAIRPPIRQCSYKPEACNRLRNISDDNETVFPSTRTRGG